jgi:precorrin-6B methylase 2
VQSSDIIKFLESPLAEEMFLKHANSSSEDIVMREKNLNPQERRVLASLLQLYKKAKEKLPEYVIKHAALNEKSYEQATSSAVAHFRSTLIKANRLLNLSGGIGADDLELSKTCTHITSVDVDNEVHNLAIYNSVLFKTDNVTRVNAYAEDFIKDCPKFDVIYIDPDRRSKKERTLLLEEASPNIVELQDQLLNIANEVYIKLSPLTDLSEIKSKLKFCQSIWVVALENEVKEVLVKLSRTTNSVNTYAVMICSDNTYVVTEDELPLTKLENKTEIFIEPTAALIKSGLADHFFLTNNFLKVGRNAAFYIGNATATLLPGRAFVIVKKMVYKPKLLKQYFYENGITYGHFKKRDFPLDVNQLKQKHKLKDGGNDYFFFYTDLNKTLQVVHAQKPKIKHSLF